ncbi:FMN-dependent NADH-azoreductase [Pelagibacterium luteolum]|uniref:FMN dependent NADH:quinone oxidoreductase n=1 Tax=Pelagibacterium luteolum TaxID=440168 RepID=A0A1G7WRW0_9HYPH|nr:NAD(P)H-dependent oxidoreductase [Pelagibacterium luteolum]SDG74634.1 FMN-dependent NADH-azoreductase [Pelagibacterium luteolum]
MTKILRIDASIRADGSVTRSVADTLQRELVERLGDATVATREIGMTPLPASAWAGAVFGPHTPAEQRTPEQQEGIALATALADELLAADAYVFALPFYNFGVSQHFKAYVDILLTEPRFAPGQPQLIAGRPAQLIIARGGGYGPGTPRHGWDHGTAWYQRVLTDILGLDVETTEVELTLADVTPAMESLREMAAENLAQGHVRAKQNAGRLAERLEV